MRYEGTKVLITGADGFIGSHLAESLVTAGADVTALALYNAFDNHGWLDDLSAEYRTSIRAVRGDVRDGAFVNRIVQGQDLVFHLAALIGIPYSYAAPHSYVETNVSGTLNVLEAARNHDVSRVVHTSTSEAYGSAQVTPITESHPLQGQSPYAASKIAADMMAEAYARSFELPVVTLRPFNTYGPRQSERAVIPTIIRQAVDPACTSIRVGDLSPSRDFNFVTDTVDAFLRMGSADGLKYGSPYNAGSGVMTTVGEVVERVVELTGVNKPIQTDQQRVRPERSEVRALQADATRLTAATGWSATTDLGAGLSKTVDWWRDRLAAGNIGNATGYVT